VRTAWQRGWRAVCAAVSDVSQKAIGKKADGTPFMSFERTVLVPKRGHAIED
jgi:hypothetical protein